MINFIILNGSKRTKKYFLLSFLLFININRTSKCKQTKIKNFVKKILFKKEFNNYTITSVFSF